MKSSDKLPHKLSSVLSGMRRYRTLLLTLSAIVVFVVSYLLILPALTLDHDEANQHAGINLETETVNAETNTLSYTGEAYEVEAAYSKAAQLPEKTTLQVSEITKKNDQYQVYCDKALKAVQNADEDKKVTGFSFVKLYDISLMADGAEVEPNAPLNVSISYDKGLEAKRADHVRVIHFDEDSGKAEAKPEILDNSHVDVTIEKDKMTEASFEADSFSVYGVVYTVDFEYEVDGNKYTYSIEGGSSISLKDLLTSLQVVQDDKNTEVNEVQLFVDDVQNVAFSSPDLVRVDHTDQGWTLTSLKPFKSTESLTVTMKNGDVFTVKVTDAQEIDDTDTVNVDKSYIICTHDNNGYHVLKTDGSVETFPNTNGFDALDNSYRWTFYYVFTEKDRETTLDYKYYFIRPIDDKSKTIALNGVGETPLIQEGTNNVAIIPQSGGGFWFKGYHNTELAYTDGQFVAGSSPSLIRIFEQEPLPQYSFTVVTDDSTMGKVSGYNETGARQERVDQYISITNEEKKNLYSISAVPVEHKNNGLRPWEQGYNQNKWIFDHWELNGEALDKNTYGQNINTNMLDIPYNSSVLKAVFKVNPDYVTPDNEKEGRTIDKADLDAWLAALENKELPLDRSGCKKNS